MTNVAIVHTDFDGYIAVAATGMDEKVACVSVGWVKPPIYTPDERREAGGCSDGVAKSPIGAPMKGMHPEKDG